MLEILLINIALVSSYQLSSQGNLIKARNFIQHQQDHVSSVVEFSTSESVISPCTNNGTQNCPSYYTCCQLGQSDGFGCCPLPDAVCCSDRLHCCPGGMVCDTIAHTCNSLHSVEDSKTQTKLLINETVHGDESTMECPGGNQSCAKGYTCCEMKEKNNFSCFPMTDAVCCEDKIHCCPKGNTCDEQTGSCQKDSTTSKVRSSSKVVKSSNLSGRNVTSVICPDGEYQCPDHTTCCALSEMGQYGCCPMENATCCQDKQHCCPNSYVCTEQGICVLSGGSRVASKETEQVPITVN